MTFTTVGEDLSQIIRYFRIEDGYIYHVYYLDGTANVYESPEEEQIRLQQIMFEQAIKRHMSIDIDDLKYKEAKSYLYATIFGGIAIFSYQNSNYFVSAAGLFGVYENIKNAIIRRTEIRELRKYQQFFEYVNMIQELPFENAIEFISSSPFLLHFGINNIEYRRFSEIRQAKRMVKYYIKTKKLSE